MTPSEYKNILIKVVSKERGEEAELQEELIKFFDDLDKGCDVYHCTDRDNDKGGAVFRTQHRLEFSSIPDFVISGRILVEVKRPTWVDPGGEAFSGKGAEQLFNRCSKSAIEAIYQWCDNFHEDESKNDRKIDPKSPTMTDVDYIVPHWSSERSDSAYDAGITFTFYFKDGTKVTLYQLDSYLLDLYYGNCQPASWWTNGLVWKIFFIENGTLKCKEFHLDKNGHDYIPPLSKADPSRIAKPSEEISRDPSAYRDFVEQHIQIDQNVLDALIDCLKSILSTH